MNGYYINANIIYGECLAKIAKPHWKRNIKVGFLEQLHRKGFLLFTSTLTKMEVLQRLLREENIRISFARKVYYEVTYQFRINHIHSLNKLNLLTNDFLDKVSCRNIDFKDALHLEIARNQHLPVITHDKKFRKQFSQHRDKQSFYKFILKPEELLDD